MKIRDRYQMVKAMPIKVRLSLSFGTVVLLMVVAAIVGWSGVSSMNRVAVASIDGDVALAQVTGKMDVQVLLLRRCEKDTLLNMNRPEKIAEYFGKWQATMQNLRDNTGRATPMIPESEQPAVSGFVAQRPAAMAAPVSPAALAEPDSESHSWAA